MSKHFFVWPWLRNKEPRDPSTLKEKLKRNRSASKSGGSGDQYWDSVIEVIEEHYKLKADNV